jgi:hypothetical protein
MICCCLVSGSQVAASLMVEAVPITALILHTKAIELFDLDFPSRSTTASSSAIPRRFVRRNVTSLSFAEHFSGNSAFIATV